MKNITLILLFLTSCNLFGQKSKNANETKRPNVEYGNVSLQDLKQTVYSIDSSAEAIVLFKKEEINFYYDSNWGFYFESKVHIRKKILKKSALELGKIEISQRYSKDHHSEKITEFEGATYNLLNNSSVKSKVNIGDIHDENVNLSYNVGKVNFPNVVVGSIIEYKYSKISPMELVYKPSNWYFQEDIPVLWSEIKITIPAYFYYQMFWAGYLPFAINTNDVKRDLEIGFQGYKVDAAVYNIAVENAPAFKNEPYVGSDEDCISKLEFELSTINIPGNMTQKYSQSWEEINESLLKSDNFGDKLNKTSYLKESIKNFEGISDPKERLEKSYYYFQKYFETDETYANSIYCFDDLKKIFENKKGTSSEQNLIYYVFLRELGYDVSPIILSTRKHGKLNKEFPILDKFNYTICQVKLNGEKYLIDISDKWLKLGMLPPKCLNYIGREVKKGNPQFIDLNTNDKFKEATYIKGILGTDGNIKGHFDQNFLGYAAYNLNAKYGMGGETKMIELYKKQGDSEKNTNLKIQNLGKPAEMLKISYDFVMDSDENDTPDIIYLNPILAEKITKNPYLQKNRIYPVDLEYESELNYIFELEIPSNFTVDFLPKSMALSLPDKDGNFAYNCTFNPETNKIMIINRINIKNQFFKASQYMGLQEFYNRIIQKQDEQIVLKKKK